VQSLRPRCRCDRQGLIASARRQFSPDSENTNYEFASPDAPPTRILHDAEGLLFENGTRSLAVSVCSLVNDQ
jgi:hypothetical protein